MLGHSQQPASPQMPSVCMLGMVCRTTCRTPGHRNMRYIHRCCNTCLSACLAFEG
jgi:hypothetical protein